jgi:sec-independent protein translocase protein TatB
MVFSPPIEVASIGMADSIILMILALVVFGPRRLPQIGKQIGKLMYEFRKASNDFKFQMEQELRNAEEADRRKKDDAERQASISEAHKAAELATSAAQSALNAAAEIRAAQTAQSPTEVDYPVVVAEAAETAPAETGLTVQPPSTGEQVAAERPRPSVAEAVTGEPETEPADQHG